MIARTQPRFLTSHRRTSDQEDSDKSENKDHLLQRRQPIRLAKTLAKDQICNLS